METRGAIGEFWVECLGVPLTEVLAPVVAPGPEKADPYLQAGGAKKKNGRNNPNWEPSFEKGRSKLYWAGILPSNLKKKKKEEEKTPRINPICLLFRIFCS